MAPKRSLEEICYHPFSTPVHLPAGCVIAASQHQEDRAALSPIQGELPDLQPRCPLCNGTGKVERFGFASAGDMDAGNDPHKIEQNCRVCCGRGFLYLPGDELTQLLRAAYAEVARLKREKHIYEGVVAESSFALGLARDGEGNSWRNARAEDAEATLATSHAEVKRLKGELAPFVENSFIADCILCRTSIWARQERIDNGSGWAHATCAFKESGKQEGRKEALDAVDAIRYEYQTYPNARKAILALPKAGE